MSFVILNHGVLLLYDQKVVCCLTLADWYQLQAVKNGKL
jgi:hypothetical protein